MSNEAPAFTKTIKNLEVVSVQFIPPATLRVEFSKQVVKELAVKRLIVKSQGKEWVSFKADHEGWHIWHVTPKRTKNGRYPLDTFVRYMLSPEVADALNDGGVTKQPVLTKELWLLKSYGEYIAAQYRREAWKKTKHPSGYTYQEIMTFDEGYREKNGYFIWRGQWQDGSRMVDGFQTHKISSYEPWNSDIRYFLKKNYNLSDAIRIQDQLWMENFRTMLAALASFYANTPSAGIRPRTPTPRNVKTPTQIPTKSLDRAVKAVESAQKLGAQAFSAYTEIKAAIEHATRDEIDSDIAKSINRDVQQFTDFIEDLSSEHLKEKAANRK